MRLTLPASAFLWALLLLLSAARDIDAATVSGRMLMKDGTPISGGFAVAFDTHSGPPPAPEKYFRLPEYIATIHNDGGFEIILPQGEYYLAAVKRQDAAGGPPREDDIFFVVKNEKGEARAVTVSNNDGGKLGDLAGGELFKPVSDPLLPVTAVAGTVIDQQGKPQGAITVYAQWIKTDKNNAMFISRETGSDGKYSITVPAGGTYTLGVWETGSPSDARKKSLTTIKIETGKFLRDVDLHRQ